MNGLPSGTSIIDFVRGMRICIKMQQLIDLNKLFAIWLLWIGLSFERYDVYGEGPDVLWLLPERVGFVIEAKSKKNALTKEQHGQLLVAAEWFAKEYPGYECVRVSVHPKNKATRSAVAGASHALTYEKLMSLVSDARLLLSSLIESQLDTEMLESECNHLLVSSNLRSDRIANNYLVPFDVQA